MAQTVRIKLTLAYMGTRFCGWQVQPGERTVQDELEKALTRLCRTPVRVHGAARTDSGVHALEQVCHVDVPAERAHLPWRKGLNSTLPKDVCVTKAERVSPDFHARYWAEQKIYAYTIWTEYEFLLPQRRPFVWQRAGLDFAAMDEAAAHFVGTHDFTSCQNSGTPLKSTVRTMHRIWRQPGQFPQEQVYRLGADGFLKQMVRNIMGCLVQVGRGKMAPEQVPQLLAKRDRKQAPATAPAQGLLLERIIYNSPPAVPPRSSIS